MAGKLCENAASVNVIEIVYESLGWVRSKYKVSPYIHALTVIYMDQPANAEAELKGSRMDVTLDIALIKSRSDSMFPNTIGAINYRNSGPFFAGTAVTNSSNLTVIVAGVNWTTNPWAYVARLRPVRPMSRNNLPFGPFADA